jgi:hypothetical protein
MSLTSRRTVMARKRYKPEEIVAKLRQVDVLVSQGQNMVDAIRQIGVSEVTYYRWRQEFGGLKTEQVKRLKDLELENSRRWPRVWTQSRNSVSVRPGAGHSAKTPSFGIPRPLGSAPRTGLDGGAITLNTIEAEATLENCRALINQIIAGLSAEEPFVNVSSAAELLLYLECAASALKRSVSRSQERGETKIVAFNYRRR